MKAHILEGFGFRLAFLSFLMLGVAGPAHAGQSGAPPPSLSQSSDVAAPAAVPGASAPVGKPAALGGQAATAGAPAAKGTQEGIKVHGHWTIEVKNPDGTVVTHREFENSLVSNSGPGLLSAMLGGAVIPGSWSVVLADGGGLQNDVIINQASSAAATFCTTVVTNGVTQAGGAGSCSSSLTLASAQLQSGNLNTTSTLTFTGSGTVPRGFPAAIGYVTTINLPCAPSYSAAVCFATFTDTVNNIQLTGRNLDGLNGDPAAVPVSALQTVAVTVVLSFQ